ncbi:MAG TPA: transketolase C-terminal domain-containing protein, partial [Pseudonocardiaceae bacterium]
MTAVAAGAPAATRTGLVPGGTPRVAENLNRALHSLFEREQRLYLLGEDVVDPYGGAFRITRGLSGRFPDRVLSTPLSEGGILGVGGGLALCGNKVIVEIMFGDFIALGFDQILNFASKSVSMYGTDVPMPLVVRCPVGGNRGYGPTHSQSPQKHFIGIPNLALYELSPFHDAGTLLDVAFGRRAPGILFEDKVLYTRRMVPPDRVDDLFRHRMLGERPGWAHAFPDGSTNPDVVVIAPGGVVHRAMDAARALRAENGRSVHVLTPAQLYPLDLGPVLPLLAAAGRVAVVEESTAGGTWGAEVARQLYERIWSSLRGPVLLLNSADSIIPTAGHLERRVLLGADDIREGLRAADGGWAGPVVPPAPLAPASPVVRPVPEAEAVPTPESGVPLIVPKLNNNDATYVVVEWLVDDGAWVEAGTEVVSLETSKAVEDVTAATAGHLYQRVAAGEERGVGDVLGEFLPERVANRREPAGPPAGQQAPPQVPVVPARPPAAQEAPPRAPV